MYYSNDRSENLLEKWVNMKSNFIKYIFIVFVIGIMAFAVYKIKSDEDSKNQTQNQTQESTKEAVREINLGIAEFDTINPILSKNKNVQDISKLIFEPLVDLSTDYKAEPCLAKEWAKQDTSYIIKLRDDVKWSTGDAFTAEDVRYTIDRLKDSSSIYSYNVQNVVSVDVIDSNTVKINLDKEVPFFEYNLTFPIMSQANYAGEDFSTSQKNQAPVGTGKYKILSVQDGSITLDKNTNWWNIKNKNLLLEKINITKYASLGEMYNAFKIGNVDLISTDNTSLQEYIGKIGYAPKEMKGREHTFLSLNIKNGFLSQTEVRQAISYSIDKENIVSSIFNNKCYTSSFPLDYGSWVYQSQNASAGYNLEQAKQVLTDAGWIFRNKYWQKTVNYRTQKLTLNLLVKSGDNDLNSVADNIKTQLENQGIHINIVQASDFQYVTMLNSGNYDIALCRMYLSPSPNIETFFGDNNLANYSNNEVSELMKEIKNTTDDATIKKDYSRLVEIYKSDVPYISLYTNKYNVAYNNSLTGNINPNWFNSFYNVESWSK